MSAGAASAGGAFGSCRSSTRGDGRRGAFRGRWVFKVRSVSDGGARRLLGGCDARRGCRAARASGATATATSSALSAACSASPAAACALPPANRPDSIVIICIDAAALGGRAQRFGAADQEAAGQAGDHDPPRRPARAPRRLELAHVGGDAALLRLERVLGLLHLRDQLVEAHASARLASRRHGGVTSMPSPFLTGLPSAVFRRTRSRCRRGSTAAEPARA